MKFLFYFFPISISIFALPSFSFAQDLPCQSYYKENGHCKERYQEDANGNIHGKYISYLPSGEKERLLTYNHGVLDGYAEIKSINGFSSGETSGQYKNGKAQGLWKTYIYVGKKWEYCWYEQDTVVACDSKPIASLQAAQQIAMLGTPHQREADWNSCKTSSDYQKFIKKYPDDPRVAEAKRIINEEDEFYTVINPLNNLTFNYYQKDLDQLIVLAESYKKKYPDRNKEVINQSLADLYKYKFKKTLNLKDLETFNAKYPDPVNTQLYNGAKAFYQPSTGITKISFSSEYKDFCYEMLKSLNVNYDELYNEKNRGLELQFEKSGSKFINDLIIFDLVENNRILYFITFKDGSPDITYCYDYRNYHSFIKLYKNNQVFSTTIFNRNECKDDYFQVWEEGNHDQSLNILTSFIIMEEVCKKYSQGINLWQDCKSNSVDRYQTLAQLTMGMNKEDQLLNAIKWLDYAIQKYNYKSAWKYKGLCLWMLDKKEEALAIFKQKAKETYDDGTPFIKNLLNTISELEEIGIIFPDEKTMKKEIKKL